MSNKIQAQYKDIGRLGREWTKVGKSLERTGAALTKKVTLPIVAAGTAAGKLYMDFDKSMAQINTLLDDVTFRKVIPSDYRLFQVADLICTMTLIELKLKSHMLSKSELLFFGDERTLKKNYLKPLADKKIC